MAIIRPGAAVGDISGVVGGVVFVSGKGSRVARRRSGRTADTSDVAYRARRLLKWRSAEWQAGTAAQRLAWDTFARRVPVPNRLGQMRQLTGFQWFCRYVNEFYFTPVSGFVVPPKFTFSYLPSFVGAYFFSGGPYLLVAWANPTPYQGVGEQLWEWCALQRGRGVTQRSAFNRYRVLQPAYTRTLPIADMYSYISSQGYDLLTGERYAVGLRWSGDETLVGPFYWSYNTVDGVPWEIDYFERSTLNPYTGDTGSFAMQNAVVHDGSTAMSVNFTNAASLTKLIHCTQGLPLFPVRLTKWEWWERVATAGTTVAALIFGYKDDNNYYRASLGAAGLAAIVKRVGGVNTTIIVGGVTGFALNTWYRMEVSWSLAFLWTLTVYDGAGVVKMTGTVTDNFNPGVGVGFFGINAAGGVCNAFFDGLAMTGKT